MHPQVHTEGCVLFCAPHAKSSSVLGACAQCPQLALHSGHAATAHSYPVGPGVALMLLWPPLYSLAEVQWNSWPRI